MVLVWSVPPLSEDSSAICKDSILYSLEDYEYNHLYIGYNNTAQVKFYSGTKQSGD